MQILLTPGSRLRMDDSAEWSDGEPSDDETEQEKKERTATWICGLGLSLGLRVLGLQLYGAWDRGSLRRSVPLG